MPSDKLVYVLLGCESAPGSDSYFNLSFTYNSDFDDDGISNALDANPSVKDAMTTFTESNYVLNILGSGRVASLESKALFDATSVDMNTQEGAEITKILYQKMKDEFDFIILVSNQPDAKGDYAGIFQDTKNTVKGIGELEFDIASSYGSSGKLTGVMHLPFITGLLSGPSLHEIMHNWGSYLVSIPSVQVAHWGASNIGGQLGGWKPGSLVSLGNNEYQAASPIDGVIGDWGTFANGGNSLAFGNFELYLMGLISAEDIGHDIKIAKDFAWVNSKPGVFTASSIDTITIEKVIEIDGTRDPNHLRSQNSFRALYVILTDKALTTSEWTQADEAVYNFALQEDNKSPLFNFWEATGGRASMQFDSLQQAIKPVDQQTNVSVPNTPAFPNLETSAEGVTIDWLAVEGATFYELYRCTTDSTVNCGSAIASLNMLNFLDTSPPDNIDLFYRVKACNPGGCSPYGPAVSVSFFKPAVAVPALSQATDRLTNVELNWTAIEGTTSYEVYRCFTDDPASCGDRIASVSGLTFIDNGGAAGIWYVYRLKACNATDCGEFSAGLSGIRGSYDAPSFSGTKLNLPVLAVNSADSTIYYAVDLELSVTGANYDFTLTSAMRLGEPGFAGLPAFDSSSSVLTIPELTVEGVRYSVQMELIESSPKVVFRILSATVL